MVEMLMGIFSSRENAEKAISSLQSEGYETNDISIITKDTIVARETAEEKIAQGAVAGAATGGIIGGLAGLLMGVGAITLPGLGGILIGGPIAAALGLTGAAATTVSAAITGALAGGLVGGLAEIGLPREQAKIYEEHIKEGGILIAVPIKKRGESKARRIMEDFGANQIRVFTINT